MVRRVSPAAAPPWLRGRRRTFPPAARTRNGPSLGDRGWGSPWWGWGPEMAARCRLGGKESVMLHRFKRGPVVASLVTLVSVAMVAFTAGPAAQARPSDASSRSARVLTQVAQVQQKPVLASEFGKARSRVRGTFGAAGAVRGTFKPRRFVVNNAGDLIAVGVVKATLVRGSGKVVGTDRQKVRIPVSEIEGTPIGRRAAPGDCDVLNLVLGPLDLDLLGLQVHLDRVVLNIIAASGAGNLLGNLLCAVTGLLDNAGLLTQVSQILNAILAVLRLP